MINTPARLLLHVPFFCLKKNLISTFEIEKKSFAEKPHRTIFFFQVGLYFGRLLVCLLTWRKKKQLPPCNYDNFCWRPQSRDPPILSLYFSLRVFQCLHTSIGALGPEVVRWPDRHIGGERAKGASRFSLLFFFFFFSYRHLRRTQTKLPIFQLFELRAAATTTTPPRTRSLLLLPTGSALFSASRPALPRRPNYTDITIRADRYLMTWPIQVKEKKKKKKKIHSAVAVIFFPGVFSEGALRRPKLTPFGLHNCLW